MLRSLIVGLGVTLIASSDALAQSCAGNPLAVQVLGSGAPGFVRDRANTSYLLWIGIGSRQHTLRTDRSSEHWVSDRKARLIRRHCFRPAGSREPAEAQV